MVAAIVVSLALAWDLVSLNIDVQVIDTLIMPIMLGVLFVLARWALPPEQQLRGGYGGVVLFGFGITCAPRLLSTIAGIFWSM